MQMTSAPKSRATALTINALTTPVPTAAWMTAHNAGQNCRDTVTWDLAAIAARSNIAMTQTTALRKSAIREHAPIQTWPMTAAAIAAWEHARAGSA